MKNMIQKKIYGLGRSQCLQNEEAVVNDGHQLITIDELAAEFRTTPGAIYAARHRGQGPRGVKIGRRLLFTREDITAWIESRREPAA